MPRDTVTIQSKQARVCFLLARGWDWLPTRPSPRGPVFRARNRASGLTIVGASPGSVVWKTRHPRHIKERDHDTL